MWEIVDCGRDTCRYALAPESRFEDKGTHFQVAISADFDGWTVTGKDTVLTLPTWVDATVPKVWARNTRASVQTAVALSPIPQRPRPVNPDEMSCYV